MEGFDKIQRKVGAGVTAFLSSPNCDCTPPTYPAFAWAGSEWGGEGGGRGRIGGWNILPCRAPCQRDGVGRKILGIGICHFSCHSSGLSNDLCILRGSQNVWLKLITQLTLPENQWTLTVPKTFLIYQHWSPLIWVGSNEGANWTIALSWILSCWL